MTANDVDTARDAMARLAPGFWSAHGRHITVELRTADHDTYRFAADGDGLRLTGNSIGSLVTGFRHYLESVGCGHISRGGSWERVPDTIPLPAEPLGRDNRCRYRYSYNFTVSGYTSPYWQWPQWEREIDLLAASGINLALVTVGVEACWLDTFTRFGMAESEVLAWISLPAHQPWQWMGNLSGFGGGMSRELVETRAALGRRVVERMNRLGIEVVLPGFAGHVPKGYSISDASPNVVPQGSWCGFDRPDWLDPSGPGFAELASAFHTAQDARFGRHRARAVDLLHEGGRADGINLADAATAIGTAMSRAHDDYLWVLQAWDGNPRPEVLAAVNSSHVLLIDLLGDDWRQSQGPHGKSWAWGSTSNFGGRFGHHGDLPGIAGFPGLADDPASDGLAGTAFMAEGVQTNPVVWSLATEISWHDREPGIEDWLTQYVRARYGLHHDRAVQAWQGLLSTVYRDGVGSPGGADSLLCAEPSLTADRASVAAPRYLPYPPEPLEIAWRDLLAARAALGECDSYRYDLIDLTRQVLSNRARVLLPLLRTAFATADLARFDALSNAFLELFTLMEPVLATRREFLLGPWLAEARALGTDPDESDALERQARTLVTSWGDTPGSAILHDYANREWAGLVAGYHRPRWESYLGALSVSLRTGEPVAPFDSALAATKWINGRESHPVEAVGDEVAAAKAVHHALTYFEGLP